MTIPNARPSDLHQQTIDDLAEEAAHWLDGSEIKSEAEAEGVGKLLDLARAAYRAADNERRGEAKPFDDGKAEVQKRYNPMLDKALLIADICKQALEPWRKKVAAAKAAEAEAARKLADEQSKLAAIALAEAGTNLDARESALSRVDAAAEQVKFAKKMTRQATTNTGLRTSHEPWVTDLNAALRHYFPLHRDRFQELVVELAKADIAKGKREGIPGVEVIETKGAV